MRMVRNCYYFIYEILLRNGIVFEKSTTAQEIRELANKIRPLNVGIELVRIGGRGDGGYLVPNDLLGISSCYSPGVSETANFENELLNKFGIESHLADYSVAEPPKNCKPKSFTKLFIGPNTLNEFITLSDWIEENDRDSDTGESILQMDIEGGEYLSILSTSDKVLKKFRIIVLEVHDVDAWSNRSHFKMVSAFFEKLLQDFVVVHIHPNNCCPNINIGGIVCPKVFEISLIRKDRIFKLGDYASLPSDLDYPNVNGKKELTLSWYE